MTIRYLIDTDTCISYMRGKFDLRTKFDEVGFDRCGISVITLAELKFGAEHSTRRDTRLAETSEFCKPLTVFALIDVLDVYAKEKSRLWRLGLPIDDFDLLIGATAIHYELVLVTSNTKHFERMQNLSIENWMS